MVRLLAKATPRSPVAWLSLERATGEGPYGMAELRLARSPDPVRRLLGHASYHGSPLERNAVPQDQTPRLESERGPGPT